MSQQPFGGERTVTGTLKILNIVSKGYPHGGAEKIIAHGNLSLKEGGFCVKTLASNLVGPAGKTHFNEFRFRGLQAFSFVAGVPISRSPLLLQYATYPLKLLFFLWNFSSFFALKKILREYRPDIVHLHTMIQVSPSVLFLLKDYPTVMTLWGPETFLSTLLLWCLTPADFKRPPSDTLYPIYAQDNLNTIGRVTSCFFQTFQRPLYHKGLAHVDLFLAPSVYMQEVALAEGLPCRHLPTFLDLQPLCAFPPLPAYSILFVGRLVNVKGVEFLIHALPLIMRQFPQTTLTIVGEGFGKTALIHLAQQLQLEASIHFVGWIPHEDLPPYYQAASIVGIPSLWPENFPTVCSEAMSAGRPVIGTRVGGIPEMIDDGVNGYLVEPANAGQIAEKALFLFSNPHILQEFGRNARRKAETCSSQEQYLTDLKRAYQEVREVYWGSDLA